jgi:hypothetical protein
MSIEKVKTIEPKDTRKASVICVIEFVPMVKRNVGIGYVTENEATVEDFKKYPVVIRPWVNIEGIS